MKLFSIFTLRMRWQDSIRVKALAQKILIVCLLAFSVAGCSAISWAEENIKVDFSQAELDQMLAPIALYPDTVLSQVLIAATYPLEIIQADRWARANNLAKGADAVKLVENKNWDPSVKGLIAFPDVLQRMSEDIDWTQKLGDAFLSDETSVMNTVQMLRKKAYSSGSLKQVEHLRVEQNDDEIVIEPAEERVVYVPVYDTRIIYGNWWWPEYPPVYWHYPSSYTYVSGFYWSPRIYIGPTFFYSSCQWRERHVVVVDYQTHYASEPHFYTSRSIVTFEGAHAWHHDPDHRRGVAYYNDNLRDTYGSHHNSYSHDYGRRENNHDNFQDNRHSVNRFDDNYMQKHPELNQTRNNGINFNSGVDARPRNEQVRERLEEQNNHNQDRADTRVGEDHSVDNRSRNEQVRARLDAEERAENNARDLRNNHYESNRNQTQQLQQPQTSDGFRPAWQGDPRNANVNEQRNRELNSTRDSTLSRASMEGNRAEALQRTRESRGNSENLNQNNNHQPVHIDDSMTRRIERTNDSRTNDHNDDHRRGRDKDENKN